MRFLAAVITFCAIASAEAQPVSEQTTNIPRAVLVAQTTDLPTCSIHVDATSNAVEGTSSKPFKTISNAVNAAPADAIICVAEGLYSEELKPGAKPVTLAGGFKSGADFKVRDSAQYISKTTGRGKGSFVRIDETAPTGDQLTVIDGFEITGYSQAILRDYYELQRFEITNNYIHDNKCDKADIAGAGFSLNNVKGRIEGNVFRNNSCDRGGAGFLNETVMDNDLAIVRNLIDGNAGTQPQSSHGGAIYIFGKKLTVTGNLFINNTVTGWGAGLYLGAYKEGKQYTTAQLSWNVYRGNRAGNGGGGMFCDDGAECISSHEIYDRNCGSNIYLDGGSAGSAPTRARFDHLTNVGALNVDCKEPGAGVRIDASENSKVVDSYSFMNSLFWNNGVGLDFAPTCEGKCRTKIEVSFSMVQTNYTKDGIAISFGPGILAPIDPLFADALTGDFHLKSTAGRFSGAEHVADEVTSPAIGKGYPDVSTSGAPGRNSKVNELGAYGNSVEGSLSN